MKKFKFKLLSLVLCFCMCLSLLSGCALFQKKDTGNDAAIAIEVGNQTMTRRELIDQYYSFYQQNYYYFMYYDEDYIMDVFYDSIISRMIVLDKTQELIDEGEIVISDEDVQGVWDDIFDYINSQVDTREKSLLLLDKNVEEEDLPKRLQSDEVANDETPYKYEPYEREEVKPYEKGTAGQWPDVDEMITRFKTEGLYQYNAAKSDDDERQMEDIPEVEREKRLEAFNKYLSGLILSAKANNKSRDPEVVFKAEVERLLKSYKDNALYEEYKEYINATVTGGQPGFEENKLSDLAIVNKYKDLFNASKENNTLEDNYVDVVTSTSSTSLILYHYEGEYHYFTVQHLLVSYNDDTLDILKNLNGYDTSKDNMFRESYEQIRDLIIEQLKASDELTTTVRDDDGYLVKEDAPATETETEGTEETEGEEEKKQVDKKITITEIEDLINDEFARINNDNENYPTEETKAHARAMAFQKFVWKYSSDTGSLKNDLSNVLGFTISEELDKHGSLVKDFANGARDMYARVKNGDKKVAEEVVEVPSDYGVHLMMLTGVYDFGDVIDLTAEGETEEEKAAVIAERLKNTYISNLTDETYYDYVYDILKDKLVGDSGTYFSDYLNKLKKEYEEVPGKIKYNIKMGYDELNDLVS